jgi:uncharacterized membrane protein YkvA (DUF1232 family)
MTRRWATKLKLEVLAIYFAARDPRVPWYAKVLAAVFVAYALSPIDLIPDFIPILGYLDDLIIVPLGLFLVMRLVPPALMAEHRERAAREIGQPPRSLAGALAVIVVWVAAICLVVWWLAPLADSLLAPEAPPEPTGA